MQAMILTAPAQDQWIGLQVLLYGVRQGVYYLLNIMR